MDHCLVPAVVADESIVVTSCSGLFANQVAAYEQMPDELRRLRRLLPDAMPILIGGRAAPAYGAVIAQINASLLGDIAGFQAALAKLRDERSLSQSA